MALLPSRLKSAPAICEAPQRLILPLLAMSTSSPARAAFIAGGAARPLAPHHQDVAGHCAVVKLLRHGSP